jgi:hypothetical protein
MDCISYCFYLQSIMNKLRLKCDDNAAFNSRTIILASEQG